MSNRIHALAQQLTGKATIAECSVDEVKHIAKRHPFFAPAQFLLLQKLKQLDAAEAETQYNKGVLFYHDPLLFDYFISSEKFYVDEENLFDTQDEQVVIDVNNEVSSHSSTPEIEFVSENTMEEAEAIEEIIINEKEEENDSSISFQEEVIFEENDRIQLDEETIGNLSEDEMTEANEEIIINENTEEKNSSLSFQEEVIPEMNDKAQIEKEKIIDSLENEIEKAENKILEEKIDEPAISFPQLSKDLNASADASALTFEPYHTVDYFASQGIKFSQEELPKDKLGKQLKSFTQWLKTMKRLPSTPAIDSSQTTAEKVETMAGLSVSQSEVVTEAMAEVWAKQGNNEKAMETYNKLSLLNPFKTAYFAAKIENLKPS